MNGSPLDRWFPELLADLAGGRRPQAAKKLPSALNPIMFEELQKRDLPSASIGCVQQGRDYDPVPCRGNDIHGVLDRCNDNHGRNDCKPPKNDDCKPKNDDCKPKNDCKPKD